MRYFLFTILSLGVFISPTSATEYPIYQPEIHQGHRIIVKFHDSTGLRVSDTQALISRNQTIKSGRIQSMKTLLPGKWKRVFSFSEKHLDNWVNRAAQKTGKARTDLNAYASFVLDKPSQINSVMKTLSSWPEVEHISLLSLPAPLPAPDYETAQDENFDTSFNRHFYQRYLDDGPDGFGFNYANYSGLHGRGNGMKVCDIEYQFLASHEDLPTITVTNPTRDLSSRRNPNHGTAVLGQLGSLENGSGTRGMVVDADLYFAYPFESDGSYNVAEGLLACADALDTGDTILIEQQIRGPNYVAANAPSQNGLVPVEWEELYFDTIQTITDAGIMVVEAAGNGAEDLDSSDYTTGNGGHYPFNGSKDSGAILVASSDSAWSTTPRDARPSTNYGSRIDVFAWGHHIVTTGYGTLSGTINGTGTNASGGDDSYANSFGGTSGASPIITSVATIAQAFYKQKHGSPASPAVIRNVIQQGHTSPGTQDIGIQPDLQQVLMDMGGASKPATPVVGTFSGTYPLPMQVSVSIPNPSIDDTIRYTLDGSEPTLDKGYQFEPWDDTHLSIFKSGTIKLKHFKYDQNDRIWYASDVVERNYVDSKPTVAKPIIQYNNLNHQLSLSSSTPGASIKYRTDGKTIGLFRPGTSYNGPFTLAEGNHTIVAKAYRDGYHSSEQEKSAPISVVPIQLTPPIFYPGTNTFYGSTIIYLGTTILGAKIHFTLDGTEPDESDPYFVEPFELDTTTTVKAKTFLSGYTPSITISKTYTVNQALTAPVINPSSGTNSGTGSLQVSISTVESGASIRYTTNGAEPTLYSTLYSNPITLGVGERTFKAKAFKPDLPASDTTTAEFTVQSPPLGQVATPEIKPVGSVTIADAINITAFTETAGAQIYYRADIQDDPIPGCSALNISEPSNFVGGGNYLYDPANPPRTLVAGKQYCFKFKAFRNGYTPSTTRQTGVITYASVPSDQLTQLPAFSPEPGVYHNTLTIEIEGGNYNFGGTTYYETLLYTQDGSEPDKQVITPFDNPATVHYSPNASSPTASVNLFTSRSLVATTSRNFFRNPGFSYGDYTLQCGRPEITAQENDGTSSITINTETTGSTQIYYTLDGSEPNDQANLYSGPFALNPGKHVIKAMCTRTNFVNSETGSLATLVNPANAAPSFIQQPQSGEHIVGEPVLLSTDVDGFPAPHYQWYKDGIPLAGERFPVLQIDVFSDDYVGTYQLKAENDLGEVFSQLAVLTRDTNLVFRNGFESSKKKLASGVDPNKTTTASQLEIDRGGNIIGQQIISEATVPPDDQDENSRKDENGQSAGTSATPIPVLNPALVLILIVLILIAGFRRSNSIKFNNR